MTAIDESNRALEQRKNLFLAKFEGYLAVVGNLLLFIFKFYVGMICGSTAIIADAWHTLSDSVSSIVLLIGLKVSERPPDEDHPFGHGRAELIVSVIIAMMLAWVGVDFVLAGIDKLENKVSADYGALAVIAMVVSILVKEAMAQYAFWAGKKTQMSSLTADGHHHRSDAVSSVIILVGIFLGGSYWWIDGVLSIIVALIILYSAYMVMREASGKLLGASPSDDLVEEVKQICDCCCGCDTLVHHLHLHEYGSHSELTFHLRLDGGKSLREAHEISGRIEEIVQRQLNITATIHMEPK